MCVLRPQCRLEANYAHQQEVDMIPLMMQRNYAPKGWRELLNAFLSPGCYHRRVIDVR